VGSDGSSERLPRHLGRGALTSLFIHGGLLFPLVTLAFILGAREEARRAQEVELTFEEVDPADLPPDLPPIEATPKPEEKKPEALALRPEPEPPPEKQPPPPPEQPPPPTPPQPKQERAHEKSVDFEIEKETEPDPNAKFLAEKNNRVEQETRAERTNLERQQKGEESSSTPSDRQDPDEGDKEDKVAKLEDRKSKLGRRAPDVTPHQQESLPRAPDNQRKSLLSMRETEVRRHQISPETVDPALPRDPNGVLPMPDEDLQSMKDIPGRGANASRSSLRLSAKQYEYLFGDDAEAAERFAQKEMSKKQGRFQSRMARVQSALENFIPEVRPGNQTALNTRAAPFAAFIARMHRSIHELWGFGFLEELEAKSSSSPYNDRSLVSKLEIVLNGDGTVDKVTVIRPSGYLPYDVAAIDVVYSAGPYADPPRAIRSRNGKIYVHWTFHRDERQCATSGVDYYILDTPPVGGDEGEESALAPGVPNPGSPRLPNPAAGRPAGKAAAGGAPGAGAGGVEGDGRGLQRLERGLGPSGGRRLSGPGLQTGEPPEPDQEASRRAVTQVVRSDDPAARGVAEQWFDAYTHGDISRMVKQAALPFRSTQGIAAHSTGELTRVFRELVAEAPAKRQARALQLYTAAGARRILGALPAGFDEGPGLLFAVGHAGGDTFVLVLRRQGSGWRAVGLVRH
jgi:outer membrane biosynthesis protein TonB